MAFWRFSIRDFKPEDQEILRMIPGLKVSPHAVAAPKNAAWLAQGLLERLGASYSVRAPREAKVRGAVLALPWLQPWVPEFLTPYQREGIQAVLSIPGECGHLWWSAGCLAGDTKLIVNRGGAARPTALRTIVARLRGESTRNPRNGKTYSWDLSIPTYTQSIDAEGFVRLNRIERAYANGIAEVFEVITKSGRTIRATAEHHFRIDDGAGGPRWRKLEHLRRGDRTMIATWPEKMIGRPKRKPIYRLVPQMWNHPFVLLRCSNRSDRPGFSRDATVPEHRLIMEAHRNGISLPELVGRIVLGRLDRLEFLDPKVFHVHHKNEDVNDNRIENLEVLTVEEHLRRHGEQGGWKHVAGRVTPDEIISITRVGEEEVFDLGMAAPMENYVANEFVVHNSGKTLGGIVWALADGPGTIVVVTKASIRGTWAREIDTYTKGCKWEILEGRNVAEKWTGGAGSSFSGKQPTFLITGYDTLPDWIGVLEALRPRSVIFDEIHTVKSNKRWDAQVDLGAADPNTTGADDVEIFSPSIGNGSAAPLLRANTGDAYANAGAESAPIVVPIEEPAVTFSLKDNRAAGAYRLSRIASRRLGATATPISDRVRDLWAQFDLIHPWEWGGYYDFCRRYCNAMENGFGGMDTRGKSNLGELIERRKYVTHRVSHATANRYLPQKRRLVTYVKVSEQVKAEGFAAELRTAMRAAQSSAQGRSTLTEMLLMEAAARKRKIVEAWTLDAVAARQKVLIFTGRRKDCARWAEEIEKAVAKLKLKDEQGNPVPCPIWHGDGQMPMGDPLKPKPDTRTFIVDRYFEAKGPAVLIATGDAFGEGLNGMHDTDLQIMAMLPYTWRQIIQREGRVARLGQKRPVLVRYPICEGTIDEQVVSILLNKLPAVEKVAANDEVAGVDRELTGASEEELINSMLAKVLKETA